MILYVANSNFVFIGFYKRKICIYISEVFSVVIKLFLSGRNSTKVGDLALTNHPNYLDTLITCFALGHTKTVLLPISKECITCFASTWYLISEGIFN